MWSELSGEEKSLLAPARDQILIVTVLTAVYYNIEEREMFLDVVTIF